jgi:hypothetical protein
MVSGKSVQDYVLWQLKQERQRQDMKWGIQNHPPEVWLAILSEEVGELATSLLDGVKDTRTEALHVAAVAVAFMECLDRAEYSRIKKNCDEAVLEGDE